VVRKRGFDKGPEPLVSRRSERDERIVGLPSATCSALVTKGVLGEVHPAAMAVLNNLALNYLALGQ